MSLLINHLYEFGEFRLDTREKILMRGETPIELTRKAFDLLTLLVENQGRLLKKDEIMEKIWADSFVEESSLTFNIGQLRKILGDDSQNPVFIKTVRQHGYRFIGDVKLISETIEEESEASIPSAGSSAIESLAERPPEKLKTGSFFSPLVVTLIVLPVAIAGIGFWYLGTKALAPRAAILTTPFTSEILSESGKVFNAGLSPDGKSIVYTNGAPNEKQSVWVRRPEDGSNIEIIPPSENNYVGIRFSPDGKMIYFARSLQANNEPINIYKVPVSGGIPQKVINDSESWFSFSADGAKISFVRCARRDDEFCSLWIADAATGENEIKLAARPRPFRIADNEISPDGQSIAFAVGQSVNGSNEFSLNLLDIGSRNERELTKEKFFNIRNLGWMPDRSSILMTARKNTDRNFRIWEVSTASGEALPLTKDSETYSVISFDNDATKLISTKIKQDFQLRLINAENPEINKNLITALSGSFAPDGRIVFASAISGNSEIWSINADGSGQRQLTNTPAEEGVPLVSPDNKSIFFVSNQTGSSHVWRMNADGSNQTQVTTQEDGGLPISVSPDGEWLYYRQNISLKLMRISLKSGEEQLVLDKRRSYFGVSPDGAQVAFREIGDAGHVLTIVTVPDGQTVKNFNLADKKLVLKNIVWSPDGKSLLYVTNNPDNDVDVLWKQLLNEEAPHQIISLTGENIANIFYTAISSDNKTYAIIQGKWRHDAVLIKGLK